MENDHAIAILGELLRCEHCNVAIRLQESTVFISSASTQAQRAVEAIGSASARHCETLTILIRELGGEPGPRGGRLSSADLHFVDLAGVLPRFITEHQALVGYYRSAAAKLSGTPDLAAVAGRVADEHQQELLTLRQLQPSEPSEAV